MMKRIITLLIVWLLPATCPPLLYGDSRRVCLAGNIDIGMIQKRGTVDSKSLSLGVNIDGKETALKAEYDYTKTEDLISQDKGLLRAGYDPKINDHWSLWFYDQVGYNNIRQIKAENFVGGGPKYTIVDKEKFKTSISVGILHHHVRREQIDNLGRFSLRVKARYKINGSLGFSMVIFYQPNIEEINDYIVNGEADLTYSLTKRLGLKLKTQNEYRSISMVSEKNNLSTVLALTFNF